jgi:hypothetical protein
MRGAFVVRLGPDTKPSEDCLQGWVEEVDSGKEVRFHSAGELIQFLGECFRTASESPYNKLDQSVGSTSFEEEETF